MKACITGCDGGGKMPPWGAIVKRDTHGSIPIYHAGYRPMTMSNITPANWRTHAFTHPYRGAAPVRARRPEVSLRSTSG